jgi:hypothetical protein
LTHELAVIGCIFLDGESWGRIDQAVYGFDHICHAITDKTCVEVRSSVTHARCSATAALTECRWNHVAQKLSLAHCGLGPDALVKLVGHMLSMSSLQDLDLSGNPICGAEINTEDKTGKSALLIDSAMRGLESLCAAMPNLSTLSRLSLGTNDDPEDPNSNNRCFLGPTAVSMLTSSISSLKALKRLTIGSTGDMGDQRDYTLRSLQGGGGSDLELELDSLNLGPSDVELVVAVLDSFEGFRSAISVLNIANNPICISGAETLAKFIQRQQNSPLHTVLMGPRGTKLPVKNYEETSLNLSHQSLSAVEVVLVAAVISKLGVQEVHLDGNAICKISASPGASPGARMINADTRTAPFADLSTQCESSKVTTLSVSDCKLGCDTLSDIAQAIGTLRTLNISKNVYGIDGASALAAVLSASELQEIVIGSDSTTVKVHAASEPNLDFSGQQFNAADMILMASAIALKDQLRSIKMTSTGIATDPRQYSLTFEGTDTLNLADKAMGPVDMRFVAAAIGAFSSLSGNLKHVILDNNLLTGAQRSADETSIEYEDVDGLLAFLRVLTKQKISLVSLRVSGCDLGQSGASALADAFPSTINELDISKNAYITTAGASALGNCFEGSQLRTIKIGPRCTQVPVHNPRLSVSRTSKKARELAQEERRRKKLKNEKETSPDLSSYPMVLDLSEQDLGPAEIMIVSKLLPLLVAVDFLDLSGNNSMGADGALALVEAVQPSSKLRTIIIKKWHAPLIWDYAPDRDYGAPYSKSAAYKTIEVVNTDEMLMKITCGTNILTKGLNDTGTGRPQAFNPVEFSGLETFEDFISREKITKQKLSEKQILDFSGQRLGVCEVKMISDFFVPNSSKLDRLLLRSTGNMAQQHKYELTKLQKSDAFSRLTGGTDVAPMQDDDNTKTLRFGAKNLGPTDMQLLARVFQHFPAFAGKHEILDFRNNPIGFDGAASIVEMLQYKAAKKNVITIMLGSRWFELPTSLADQAELKCSDRGLGPADAVVIASIMKDSAVQILDLSKNKFLYGEDGLVDSEQRGWSLLCAAMRTCKLEKLAADRVGMGPVGLSALSTLLNSNTAFAATLDIITLSSTGDMAEQKTYSLNNLQAGPASLELSFVNIGPADLCFVATVLKSFESFATRITTVDVSGNQLFGSKATHLQIAGAQDVKGRDHTIDADQTGWTAFCAALSSQHCPLKRLSAADVGMGPVGLAQLAKLPMAEMAVLNLSLNKCFGEHCKLGGHTVDANQSGWNAVCSVIQESPLQHLDISDVGMGTNGLQCLASLLKPGRRTKTTLTWLGIAGNQNLDDSVINPMRSEQLTIELYAVTRVLHGARRAKPKGFSAVRARLKLGLLTRGGGQDVEAEVSQIEDELDAGNSVTGDEVEVEAWT